MGTMKAPPTSKRLILKNRISRLVLSDLEPAEAATPIDPPRTLGEMHDRWLARRQSCADVQTMRSRRANLALLDPLEPAAFTEPLALSLRERLEGAGLAPRTVDNHLRQLRSVYNEGRRRGWVSVPNPITRDVLEGLDRDADLSWRSTAYYTGPEVDALQHDPRVYLRIRGLVWGLILTGGRHGEVAGLRVRDIDWTRPSIRFAVQFHTKKRAYTEPKTKVGKEVPLHPEGVRFLRWWLSPGGGWALLHGRDATPEDILFPCNDRRGNPRPWRSDRAGGELHEALEALGFRPRGLHDFRRTFYTLGRDAGVQREVLERICHPRVTETSDLYLQIPWPTMVREVSKLPIKYRGPTAPGEGS